MSYHASCNPPMDLESEICKLWGYVNTLQTAVYNTPAAGPCCYDDTKAVAAVSTLFTNTPSVHLVYDPLNNTVTATAQAQWIRNLFSGTNGIVYNPSTGQFSLDAVINVPTVTADNGLTKTLNNIQLGGTLLMDTLILGGTSAQATAGTHYGMWWRDMNYYMVQGKVESGPGKSDQPTFQMVLNDNSFTYKFFAADNDTNFYSNWNGNYFMEQINDHGNYQLERYSGVSSTGVDLSYLKHGYEAEYQRWITNQYGTYEIDTTESWMMMKGSGGKGRIKLLFLSQGQVQMEEGGNGDQYATGYLATEDAVRLFCGKIDEAQMPWYDDPSQLAYQKGIKIKYGGDLTFGMYPNTRTDAGTPTKVLSTDASGNVVLQALPTAPATVTADNGLTKTTNNIQLGGTLLKNTSVDGNGAQYGMYWNEVNEFWASGQYYPSISRSGYTFYLADGYYGLELYNPTDTVKITDMWTVAGYTTKFVQKDNKYDLWYYMGTDTNGNGGYKNGTESYFISDAGFNNSEGYQMVRGNGNSGSATFVNYVTGLHTTVGSYTSGVVGDWTGVYLFSAAASDRINYDTYTAGTYSKGIHIKRGGQINFGVTTEHADNAAALAAGLVVGDVYRTGDLLKIVH